MTHEELKEKLEAFIDRELAEAERAVVTEHLAACRDCREALQRFEKIRGLFSGYTAPKPSESFVHSVMTRLEDRESEQTAEAGGGFLPRWLFPVFGYSLALLTVAFAVIHRGPLVTTDMILMNDLPQSSHWAVSPEMPPIDAVFQPSTEVES